MKTRRQRLRDLYRDPLFDNMFAATFFSTLVWGVWAWQTESPGLALFAAMGYLYFFVPLTDAVVGRVNEMIDESQRKRKAKTGPPPSDGPSAS